MKRGRASSTSTFVTFCRALGDSGFTNVHGFKDPTARSLLPPGWVRRLEVVERRKRSGFRYKAVVQAADVMALRTTVLDEHVREAIAGGARQLVILGAGLDGRAFRMPELSEVDVFELDHPDTQGPKRERSATLTRTCRSLRFVAIDFERDSLERALEDAGHRRDVPTVWLWEGVVMYLRDEAVRSTLSVVSARSAPGSTIAVQYNTREGHSLANALMLRIWGEPQIGLRTPEKMASELEAAGFRVVADACAAEWASSRGAPPPGRSSAKRLRIAVARK